jgi:hypothetical protein
VLLIIISLHKIKSSISLKELSVIIVHASVDGLNHSGALGRNSNMPAHAEEIGK